MLAAPAERVGERMVAAKLCSARLGKSRDADAIMANESLSGVVVDRSQLWPAR